MLNRVWLTSRWSQRFLHQGYRSQFVRNPRKSQTRLFVSSALVASAILYYSTNRTVHGDALFSARQTEQTAKLPQASNAASQDEILNVVVWGSNKENLISPDTPEVEAVKTPSVAGWLKNVALRDMALHQRHAACVDARGDVYQWGDGFYSQSDASNRVLGPTLTLRGKNIVSLQLTASRVFALSASGHVYVLPAVKSEMQPFSSTSWWARAWPLGRSASSDPPEIVPRERLSWGEKFVSISAGDDHLLALTSVGRTFAHPITANANNSGQLGFSKFEIGDGKERREVQLNPKAVLDPLAKASAFVRQGGSETSSNPESLESVPKNNAQGFCDRLFEIPSLREVNVSQIATGERSSYVRTSTGKVLGWGANEYGQIGQGSNVIVDPITVPTEIVLWRTSPDRTKCLDLSAGGNLACFTVEQNDNSGVKTIDLLVCGNGQWGGLGNNLFSNAQGTPVRAKYISGLLEYCEQSQTRKAILPRAISVSPTGHVLLTLDTLTRATIKESGSDLFVWGANYEYALGIGKRGSVAVPTGLQTADGERFMLKQMRAKEVRDLSGSVWKRSVLVEQRAVAGYGNSAVYWQIR